MNLSTLTLTQLKATAVKYALQVDGDKRLRSTWEDAIESATEFIAAQVDAVKDAAIALAQETLTYDNAVATANAVNAITRKSLKFTLKAVWGVLLVSIALTCIAIDLWQDRAETKAFLTQVLTRVKAKVRDRWTDWTEMGDAIVQLYITEPVAEMRDRLLAIPDERGSGRIK